MPKDEYDDEDGHYKVEVDKDLTDRCWYFGSEPSAIGTDCY